MNFIKNGTKAEKSYTIRPAKKDANGVLDPASERRIVSEDSFVKAAEGMLKINEDGSVGYQACFAAGTLVHTDRGLLPIEQVRVGTNVLSQPEDGGDKGYRPVINTVAHLDQQVYAVQVKVEGADALTTLIATPKHPFWVESPLADGKHWLAAEYLEPGFVVQVADGRKASVHEAGLVRRTQYPNLAFAADDRAGAGVVLDVSGKQPKRADNGLALSLDRLQLGEPFLTPVYNFEVEEFHTYYVGDSGVWVHNTDCNGRQSRFINELKDACFGGDTTVLVKLDEETPSATWGRIGDPRKAKYADPSLMCNHPYCEIRDIVPGAKVLTRCEKTGELAYRNVISVFERLYEGDDYYLLYLQNDVINVTGNHPIWVIGKGWIEARRLTSGDELLSADGEPRRVLELVQQEWEEHVVYNLEVEDFHTYFVSAALVWVHNCNKQSEIAL